MLLCAFLALCHYFTSLPKLYFYLSSKRDIPVKELRRLEKAFIKITKLRLDIIYFERCLNLKICPKFLLFKPPKLKAYHRTENIRAEVIKNQLGVLRRELQMALQRQAKMETNLRGKMHFVEYKVLINKVKGKCRSVSDET